MHVWKKSNIAKSRCSAKSVKKKQKNGEYHKFYIFKIPQVCELKIKIRKNICQIFKIVLIYILMTEGLEVPGLEVPGLHSWRTPSRRSRKRRWRRGRIISSSFAPSVLVLQAVLLNLRAFKFKFIHSAF